MGSWLDTQPVATIRCALTPADVAPDGSGRFGLWLELVDLHLDQLHVERSQLDWEWESAYDQGWSPRTAAFAAWAKHRRVHLTGQDP
jgi:hypothetical protein